MRDAGANHWQQEHAAQWEHDHNWEMALIHALQRLGYSRDDSRKMADAHRSGAAILVGHNGGPGIDDAA